MASRAREIATVLAAIVFAIAGIVMLTGDNASANSIPSLEAVRSLPAAGFQKFESFSVTCAATATEIKPTTDLAFNSLYCENNSTTSVFVGGSSVTTSNAPCISTTSATCLRSSVSAEVARGLPYCVVASGTQAIKCLAGN